MSRALLLLLVLAGGTGCRVQSAASPAKALYLANAGVLITHGDTKIVFDPLFRNDFGTYRLLPEELERALFAGEPPFDGLDAVLISHYHEDHFSPPEILRLLQERKDLRLYAPAQAVVQMTTLTGGNHPELIARITEIALDYEDEPIAIETGGLLIEAVRIPHSGWPERQLHVENIAYRVTLDETATVLHLGDADTRDVHFAHDAEYWERRHIHMAFPPYWYLLSEDGRHVLDERLKPGHVVGVHVPVERPAELRDVDVFTEPGESRDIRP